MKIFSNGVKITGKIGKNDVPRLKSNAISSLANLGRAGHIPFKNTSKSFKPPKIK